MPNRDEKIMAVAIGEAKKGWGNTSPNPTVGAVLVSENKIIAKGYHKKAGAPHAEIEALKKVRRRAEGMTLYVTLEPCIHQGRTPPCVNVVIKSGVSRVVVGMLDPNPVVNGKGIKALRKAKISVKIGVLEEECRNLNRPHIKYITTGRPLVCLKIAATMDGMVATSEGESQWITGKDARRRVHEMRSRCDAILVGSNTIVRDDPRLTVRMGVKGRDPIRIVLDSTLYLNPDAKIFHLKSKSPTVVATTERADPEKAKIIKKNGGELLFCKPDSTGRVDLEDLLDHLGRRGITSLMLEGGPVIHSAFLNRHLVDCLHLFVSPKFIGGSGLPMFTGLMTPGLQNLPRLYNVMVSRIGEDIFIEGEFSPQVGDVRPR